MESDELRGIQAPLKARYREDAASAVVTLHAEGELGADVTCSVETGRALVEAGLHPASGGDGTFACSGDMLLQALVACAGVTLTSVATNRGIALAGGTVRAEGDLDFRGTMGVDREAPVGFRAIRLTFALRTDVDQDTIDQLIATTERYCVVLQTITNGPPITVAVESRDA
ncbi:MAG TPA: OsmC family protein [Acidimicrobiales bacterium]|nr:OsmC family protein [Acidimicrobiales bacterium]